MGLFSSVIQLFGLLGLFKYILDQATMNALRQMMSVLHEMAQSNAHALPAAEKKRLLTDVSSQLWVQLANKPVDPKTTYGLMAPFVRAYELIVPEAVRWVVSFPGWVFMAPFNWITGKDSQAESSIQDRTRDCAIQGMWSFILPAALGLLSAYLLVREVEYVQVYGEEDFDSDDMRGRVVKRIMVGGGRLTFSIPHHPVILIVAQFLVGLTVFHTVGFLIFLFCYQPGPRPSH